MANLDMASIRTCPTAKWNYRSKARMSQKYQKKSECQCRFFRTLNPEGHNDDLASFTQAWIGCRFHNHGELQRPMSSTAPTRAVLMAVNFAPGEARGGRAPTAPQITPPGFRPRLEHQGSCALREFSAMTPEEIRWQ
jgi:hypothetical protein